MNEHEVYIEIGNRIRLLRRWRGLTQFYVAKRMGIERTSITNAEKGRQRPPVWNLLQIAEVLKVPPHIWLLAPDDWRAWCNQQGVVVRRREYKMIEKTVERLQWVEVEEAVT